MTRVLMAMAGCAALLAVAPDVRPLAASGRSILNNPLLITWYGNPHSPCMGALGQATGEARASALRAQMEEYAGLTERSVLGAYHLIAVVAQPHPGTDGAYRRRESPAMIESLLDEARANGYKLILDLQPGRSPPVDEVEHLREFLAEPDVHLALDPEFVMVAGQAPGQVIGSLRASQINPVMKRSSSRVTCRTRSSSCTSSGSTCCPTRTPSARVRSSTWC